MNTYIVQLSQYGTVAYRADVTVDAKSEEEAIITAERRARGGEYDFGSDFKCVDNWEFQAEDVKEISHGK